MEHYNKYMKSNLETCPQCGEGLLEVDSAPEIDGQFASVTCGCDNCEARFTELFEYHSTEDEAGETKYAHDYPRNRLFDNFREAIESEVKGGKIGWDQIFKVSFEVAQELKVADLLSILGSLGDKVAGMGEDTDYPNVYEAIRANIRQHLETLEVYHLSALMKFEIVEA